MEPFKLLRKDCSIDQLRTGFTDIGFDLEDALVPDSAYEDSVLLFVSNQLPNESIKIVIEKLWWPDGENWEDAIVSLRHNNTELARIDLQSLLREKLDKPLRQLVLGLLLDAASEMNSAGT